MRTTYNAQNAGRTKQAAPFIGPIFRPQTGITTGNAARRSGAPKRNAGQPRLPRIPRVPNFLNPLSPHPVPSVLSDGMALPHTSLVSDDFQIGAVNSKILVVSNCGNAGTVGYIYEVTPTGGFVGVLPLTIPTVSASDRAGGPSAGRAMKFSCSVINCTNALKRGGRVTYINSSQRLPAMAGTTIHWDLLPLLSGIKSSPYRRRIMGETLVEPKQLIGFPVDSSAYARFGNWRGTLTMEEFNQHTLGASDSNPIGDPLALSQRPMSVVAFLFDPVTDLQDYSVTIRASYYTRWPLTSVPGQSMKSIPTAPAAVINHVNDHVEASANDLVHVGEGALAATLGPRLATAIGGVARTAISAARAGGAVASEAGMEMGSLELLAPLLAI